jgi:hypothetical protein
MAVLYRTSSKAAQKFLDKGSPKGIVFQGLGADGHRPLEQPKSGGYEMRKIMTGFAFTAALALCGGSAIAADQLIVGKKLLIKNPGGAPSANNKIVFLSKDTATNQPSGVTEDPRCTPDGTALSGSASAALTVTGSESFSIPLLCDNWTVNGGGNLFKYKDNTGASCTLVMVKDGKLVKAICKGTQVDFDLGAGETSVDVVLRTGPTNRYCAEYAAGNGCATVKDGSDGKTYLVKNCTAAPAACGASPSGAFVDLASLF